MMKTNEQKRSEAIRTMVEKRRDRIRNIQREIEEYQEMCPHFDVIVTRHVECLYCGKLWSVDS